MSIGRGEGATGLAFLIGLGGDRNQARTTSGMERTRLTRPRRADHALADR